MNPITPPTDNLYKFMAITGLIIILVCMFYPNYKLELLELDMIRDSIELQKLHFEVKTSNEEIDNYYSNKKIINNRLQKILIANNIDTAQISLIDDAPLNLDELRMNIYNEKYREAHVFYFEHRDDLIPEFKGLKEISKISENINKKVFDIQMKLFDVSKLNAISKHNNGKLKTYNLIALVGNIIGSILMIFGFSLWYNKTQKVQDEILKKQNQ